MVALCVHQLAMSCSQYKNDSVLAGRELTDYKEDVMAEISTATRTCEELRGMLIVEKGKVSELQMKLLETVNQSEVARSSLEEEKHKAYELGAKETVGRFLLSPEYKSRLERNSVEARERAVREILKSMEMEQLLLKNVMNDHCDGFFKAVVYMKQLGFQPPISFDEFEADYKTKEVIRTSLVADGLPNPISYPEFKVIVEEVEEEIRKWREGLGSPEFMVELEATVGQGNEVGDMELQGVSVLNLDNIDESGSNVHMVSGVQTGSMDEAMRNGFAGDGV